MNFIFLSPHFPPNYYLFCVHLRATGARVLGLGDQPYHELRPELREALSEYYWVADLHEYDQLLRATGYFIHRYGRIDRLDSLNEHWLETEARLRSDFNIPGIKLQDLPPIKRKSVMKEQFRRAGIAVARGIPAEQPEQIRAFVNEVGLPIVAKPDIGVGAQKTYKLSDQPALEHFLAELPAGYFLEEYISGTIQTFDGLADRSGEPVFFTSMEYSRGVMEVVNADDDVYYYTLRQPPADLEAAGRRVLAAFDVRERFFHFEFFRTSTGELVALEVNMRPPGGLSIDMFNYAYDTDLYRQWAELLVTGQSPATPSAPYHACYAGRKQRKRYQHSHGAILERFAPRVMHHQPMPEVFRSAMGDYGYLFRSSELDEVVAIARFIQAAS